MQRNRSEKEQVLDTLERDGKEEEGVVGRRIRTVKA